MSGSPSVPRSSLAQIRRIFDVPPNIFGLDYLQHLARRTSEVLGVDYVLIGSTSLDGAQVSETGRVDVVIPMLNGEIVDCFSYSLRDTPCLEVLSNERVCSFFGDVQARFPEDLDLVELEATSYVGAPILGPDGELKGIFAVLNRETMSDEQDWAGVIEFLGARAGIEFHRMEQLKELSERTAAQQQQRKFESLGRLAGGIAHDFNNILSSILGHAELLEFESSEHSRQMIIDASIQGKDLTRQLLDFARPGGTQEREASDLLRILHQTCHLLERGIHRKLAFEIITDLDLAWVNVSASALRQIVMNLVLNARDAQDEGVPVRLHLSVDTMEGVPWVVLDVTDDGVGIAPEDIHKIFEPFYTTKSAARGTGLGLATVYGLVNAHQGEISVQSRLGEGTTMSVRFLAQEPPGQTVASQPSAEGDQFRGKKWLVLEDETAIRDVLKALLSARGYEVSTAANSDEAMELLSNPDLKFDGVISDLNLSGQGALPFLEFYRSKHPGKPIVVITGDPTTPDAVQVLGLKGTMLVSKPFRARELVAVIESAHG